MTAHEAVTPHKSTVSSGRSHSFRSRRVVDRLWDAPTKIEDWTIVDEASHLFQTLKTAFPIWLADMLSMAISIGTALVVFRVLGAASPSFSIPYLVCCAAAFAAAGVLSGLYPGVGLSPVAEIRLVMRIICAGVIASVIYELMHAGEKTSVLFFPIAGGLMCGSIPHLRVLARKFLCRCKWWGYRAVVIGDGNDGIAVLKRLQQNPQLGIRPVAVVDDFSLNWLSTDVRIPADGVCSLEETPELRARYNAVCAIFAGGKFSADERLQIIDALSSLFPQLYVTVDSAAAGRLWSGHLELGKLRLLKVTERLLIPGARTLKRAIDLTIAILLAPLVAAIVCSLAILVKVFSPGPAFYCQKRIGRNGRTIYVWKLRSMVANADRVLEEHLTKNPYLKESWERLHKLPNDPRVTRLGYILRKTSMDELPQLWNVLRGDLSLVGPRPIVEGEIEKYRDVYPLYLRVTPGITGLWQINGRNSTTYEERISYDAEYVRNWSVSLDLYILARTIQTVFSCHGAC